MWVRSHHVHSSLFSQEKSPEISGDYGKLQNLRKQIPGSYRAIIFPSPDRWVRRHPVWVAETCVRSCNSVSITHILILLVLIKVRKIREPLGQCTYIYTKGNVQPDYYRSLKIYSNFLKALLFRMHNTEQIGILKIATLQTFSNADS